MLITNSSGFDDADTHLASGSLLLKATTRFIRDYDRAQPLLRVCVLGALSDLRRAFALRPDQALRRYNKVKGIEPTVLEVDVAGAERMLIHWCEGSIYLLAVGGHDIVSHYKNTGKVKDEIARCKPLPERIAELSKEGFFTFDLEEEWRDFANEADPSWLTYLDAQQARAVNRILSRTSGVSPRGWYFALLVGGPGTGKTSVLLSLFDRAFECNLIPQFVIEDQVADYVKSAVGIDLADYRCTVSSADRESHGGILLVDDPNSASEIEEVRWLAQKRRFRAVVVGVDPLQLSGDFDDEHLKRFLGGSGSELVPLKVCYRQKSAVGQATKRALDAVASSSPYLAVGKKVAFAEARKGVTELSNAFDFNNPGGRFKVYPAARQDDIEREVSRLVRARGLWQHWTPYLVAYDEEGLGILPKEWKRSLSTLPNARIIPLDCATAVKGIEFQHAVLILSERLFLQLEQGFEGATRRVYEARRLLRIPISRAKDSVVVFVRTAD